MATKSPRRTHPQASGPSSARQLIVVTKAHAGLRAAGPALTSVTGAKVGDLNSLLRSSGASMTPLFGAEDRVLAKMAVAPAAAAAASGLTSFYQVHAEDGKLDKLARDLLRQDLVDGAFVRPRIEPPTLPETFATKPTEVAPPTTPSFLTRQMYLEAAPGGIDAKFAWTRPGGQGQGVRIIDIEGEWRFSHEDLAQNQGGVVGGVPPNNIDWRNHGTAVLGEFSGDDNPIGVTGICPLGNVRAISIFGAGQSPAKAITDAANALSPGDIILVELHAPGPRFNFQNRNDQLGYIGMEFWPDIFAAIVFATSARGVIVVEAGGNGAENLDDALYNTRPTGFPASWTNPFNPANPQSGAIMVGAGAPPLGTHGRNWGADRSRLDFSNYGARVDVQGWGREVTTCGYGDLQGGTNEDFWYTDVFSGTSSASPIIVGAVGCMQGGLRGGGKPLLTPATAKNILRTTGSPQQDEPGRPATQRIGNRPDLRQAFQSLGIGGKSIIKDIRKEVIKEKEFKEQKDTKEIRKDIIKEKELKEKDKEKEVKEFKEIKEKEKEKEVKEIKERKEIIKEKDIRDVPQGSPEGEDLGDRVARLEQTVAALTHFISASQRPDLIGSALGYEQDLAATGEDLERQAAEAKGAKDQKDIEKLRES